WANIRASDGDLDGCDPIEVVLDNIRSHIDPAWEDTTIDFVHQGSVDSLRIMFFHNTYGPQAQGIIDFFSSVAEIAPGSHGLLYLMDLQGKFLHEVYQRPYGESNLCYTVLVMARGRVVRRKDPFFSPHIPRIQAPEPVGKLSYSMRKYLPLGSVVTLNGGEKKLMVFGRCQKDTAGDRTFDYVGCPYPEGNIVPRATFLFDHDDIAWVHYLGFADEDEEAWTDKLKSLPPSGEGSAV
ncbi:MAG: DUF4176 domain-containing protein, partial [Propionibacteriaceae bacterium]|nr:DUF4176 domain-containing protein [Propionibacteriaceae bacterium]